MRSLALVTFGNFFYFLFIFLLFALTGFCVWLCHKFGKKFAKRFISIVLWANFGLHFAKQFLPFYISRWPYGLADSAFPNLCAVLIVLAPFIFHFGGKYSKDYFYYIGLISGFAVYFVPTGAMRTDVVGMDYAFETARFYLCHWPLAVCSLLMVEEGFHKLDWKRWWALPLMFCGVLVLISADQILFGPILHLEKFPQDWVGPDGVLNHLVVIKDHADMNNQSMQFGPQPGLDKIISPIYPYLIPGLMTYKVDGQYYFTPAIWIMPFIYLFAFLFTPVLAYPFCKREMRMDVEARRQIRKMRRNNKRARS